MHRKETNSKDNIQEKLDYLGLDLENIPKNLTEFDPLDFKINKFSAEKQYKQYKVILYCLYYFFDI